MTDLSLASHEEIIAELSRRYPCYVIAVVHPVEGQMNFATRLDFSGKRGLAEPYGLALILANSLQQRIMSTSVASVGIPPLDPPR